MKMPDSIPHSTFRIPHSPRALRTALGCYLAVTLLGALWLALVFLGLGKDQRIFFIQAGPRSDLGHTLVFVAIAWGLLGGALVQAWRGVFTRRNLVFWICFYALAFLYLNLLREQTEFPDQVEYLKTARNLAQGLSFPPRYLYPPLWATALQLLLPLGEPVVAELCVAANFFSLLALFVLLWRALVRCGFHSNSAAPLVFLLLAVNVPVLRTLYYGQVNLHVANLILICLLGARRRVWLSALALGLAVHLKISPVILVLPFLLTRNARWLGWFAGFTLGVAVLTSLLNGCDYYDNCLRNLANIAKVHGENDFRENSINGLVHTTAMALGAVFHFRFDAERWVTLPLKGLVLLAGAALWRRLGRRNVFGLDPRRADLGLYHGFVVLSFLMVLLSPVLWEHYPVFLLFPFLLMLKPLATAGDYLVYGLAWHLIFLMPTFDCYPLSYHRLLGIALCGALLFRVARRRPEQSGALFNRLNRLGRGL